MHLIKFLESNKCVIDFIVAFSTTEGTFGHLMFVYRILRPREKLNAPVFRRGLLCSSNYLTGKIKDLNNIQFAFNF